MSFRLAFSFVMIAFGSAQAAAYKYRWLSEAACLPVRQEAMPLN
jgi:hypothetical protein